LHPDVVAAPEESGFTPSHPLKTSKKLILDFQPAIYKSGRRLENDA
jgi:hypothetical protein